MVIDLTSEEKVCGCKLSSFSRIGILHFTFAKDAELVRIKLTDREDFDILDKTDIKENLYVRYNA